MLAYQEYFSPDSRACEKQQSRERDERRISNGEGQAVAAHNGFFQRLIGLRSRL